MVLSYFVIIVANYNIEYEVKKGWLTLLYRKVVGLNPAYTWIFYHKLFSWAKTCYNKIGLIGNEP